MSLVEKARASKAKSQKDPGPLTDEEVEVVVAWLNNEISNVQLADALSMKQGFKNRSSHAFDWIVSRLRRAAKEGRIEVRAKEKE